MIGISSCLGGICCRYDGKSQEQEALKQLVTNGKAIMICPEVLGELLHVRQQKSLAGMALMFGRILLYVYTDNGEDVTEAFKAGTTRVSKIKSPTNYNLDFERKSPSCGSQLIYDGQFSGIKKLELESQLLILFNKE